MSERVIDSHIHFWDPGRLHYAWLDGTPELRRPFRPGDVDTGGYAIDGFISVQADCRAEESLAEVDWVAQLAAEEPALRAVVAHVAVERGVRSGEAVAAMAARPEVVGVRRLLQDEPPGFAVAAGFVAGVRLVGEHDLVFDLCVRHHQLAEVAGLVDRCPEVRFVLDHVGKPAIAAGRWASWRRELADLAQRPNVSCKLSGLTTEAGGDGAGRIVPYLQHALDVFGPHRCMYGSDWPVATLTTSYARWLELVLAAIDDLPETERRRVLHGTAATVYGLTPTDSKVVPSC